MRKGLFAIALVAASFAGGAVVNGPGLEWAKSVVSDQLGQVGIGDNAGSTPKDLDDMVSSPAVEEVPAAPGAPLILGSEPGPGAEVEPEVPSDEGSLSSPPGVDAPQAPSVAPSAVTVEESPRDVGVAASDPTEATAEGSSVQPPIDEAADLPSGDSGAIPSAPPETTGQESGPWDDVPGSAPASAVVPNPGGEDPKPDDAMTRARLMPPAPDASPGTSPWGALRQRMVELGVTRYWIEAAEAEGVVSFRCVIPLAGERAVSEHFEAEADDAIQAAERALRRISLWRAAVEASQQP